MTKLVILAILVARVTEGVVDVSNLQAANRMLIKWHFFTCYYNMRWMAVIAPSGYNLWAQFISRAPLGSN